MKKIILILLIIGSIGCNQTNVTNNEVIAVQSVLDFYGGICQRYKGQRIVNSQNQAFFELELSDSKLIENFSNQIEIPASHIAYLFYSKLGHEKEKYDLIKVSLNLSNDTKPEFFFSTKQLDEVNNFVPIFDNVLEKIVANNFEEVLIEFDETIAQSLKTDQIKDYALKQDSIYGQITDAQFMGFKFFTSAYNNRASLKLFGGLIREKTNTTILIIVDKETKKLLKLNL